MCVKSVEAGMHPTLADDVGGEYAIDVSILRRVFAPFVRT